MIMRQTTRQCPFYISFIEKHSQIKIVVWNELIQYSKAPRYRWETIADFFMMLSLQYTVANLSRLLYNTVANLASQFSLFGKLWDLVSRKGLFCVNLTALLHWGRCLVKHNCCYPPVAEWDSSVLYFEDCKFSTFPSRCWRVVHCGRASLGGNHLVNQAAACRSPGARAAHPSQTLSASLSHSRWTFHQFGKNMQKHITLSTPIYHPAVFSQKSEEKKI